MSLPRAETLNPVGQKILRQLMLVWLEFERRLDQVPVIRRLHDGSFERTHYLELLRNLRPQVVEGARWITRAASSFDRDHLEIRAMVIRHAADEHRDYRLLEEDYVAAGGRLEEIQAAERNVGTEALNGFLMNQASQQNPTDLLGAMFIIEGLGEKMASGWARRIHESLGIDAAGTRFLSYHGENDETHMDRLYKLLDSEDVDEAAGARIVKTARVVARLYALQLEEIGNV